MNVAIDLSLTYLCLSDTERIKKKAIKYGEEYLSLDRLLFRVENVGVNVSFHQMYQARAAAVRINGEMFIGINSELSEAEQIKSILHECGHCILHAYNQQLFHFICSDSFVNYREMEADFFAFLCSGDWIREQCHWSFFRQGARIGENVY